MPESPDPRTESWPRPELSIDPPDVVARTLAEWAEQPVTVDRPCPCRKGQCSNVWQERGCWCVRDEAGS